MLLENVATTATPSGNGNVDLIYSFVGVGILTLFIIIYLIINHKRNGNKEKAKEFLDGILDQIRKVVANLLADINFADLKDPEKLSKVVAEALKSIYDNVWEFVKSIVGRKEDDIDDAALAFLNNKRFIENYTKSIIEDMQIEAKLEEKAEERIVEISEEVADEVEKADQENIEKFSDQSEYIENLDEEKDLTRGLDLGNPTDAIEGYEEVPLIPQRDEEEELDPENDPSVEVINEDDDIYYDKSGRARSKKTGKWVSTKK